jgi:protein SCO1/2
MMSQQEVMFMGIARVRAYARKLVFVLTVALAAALGVRETFAEIPSRPTSDQTETSVRELGSRFMLTAHDGRTMSDEDFQGRHMLVFFGYTHCPDVCPTSLLTVARVLELLGEDAAKVQPVFITVDPGRDTRAVLAEFVPHFDSRIIGLTGPEAMIERVAKGYRVKHSKVPGNGGDGFYTIDHTATLFHMGPDGAFVERFAYETTPEQIVVRLRDSFVR